MKSGSKWSHILVELDNNYAGLCGIHLMVWQFCFHEIAIGKCHWGLSGLRDCAMLTYSAKSLLENWATHWPIYSVVAVWQGQVHGRPPVSEVLLLLWNGETKALLSF